jgi:hypothetical protein
MANYAVVIKLGKPFHGMQPQNVLLKFPLSITNMQRRLRPGHYQPGCSCLMYSSFHRRHHANENGGHDDHYHQYHRRQQQRSSSPNQLQKVNRRNPYDVLGIPRNSSADTIKRKFLQLALRHHPDTNRHGDIKQSSSDKFVEIRAAFDRINLEIADRNKEFDASSKPWFTEEEFNAWFYEETGQNMDAATRREVMHVYRYVNNPYW